MANRTCSIKGCGRAVLARRWCSRCYQRWQKYGDPHVAPAASPLRGGSRPTCFVEVGQHFGRWVVTGPEVRISSNRRAAPVKCSCPRGIEKIVAFSDLFDGRSQSCGCLRGEMVAQRNREANPAITHGLTSHPLFDSWRKMLSRCENPADKDWPNYGGRGISLCEAWHDVAVYVAWIETNLGSRPAGMTVDRINNDGNYEPGNVRWATVAEQNRNRRPAERWRLMPGSPAGRERYPRPPGLAS